MSYDSTHDTFAHIVQVRTQIRSFIRQLERRAADHDASKLEEPEKSAFDRETPNLRGLTYGSPEYKAATTRLGDALKHHYAHNRHHPEHHAQGIFDMDLVDLVEMLCDWKAATERHDDGDIHKSLAINGDRYGISPQLRHILSNTIRNLWPEGSS